MHLSNENDIKFIIIPNGILEIGDGAFEKCQFLSNITIQMVLAKLVILHFQDLHHLLILKIVSIQLVLMLLEDVHHL